MINLKRTVVLNSLILMLTQLFAQGPNNSGTYYKNADGKKGSELKTAFLKLSGITRNCHTTPYGTASEQQTYATTEKYGICIQVSQTLLSAPTRLETIKTKAMYITASTLCPKVGLMMPGRCIPTSFI